MHVLLSGTGNILTGGNYATGNHKMYYCVFDAEKKTDQSTTAARKKKSIKKKTCRLATIFGVPFIIIPPFG